MKYFLGRVEKAHEDERRIINECNGPDFAITTFVIKQADFPLGLHYHERKRETFTITSGSGEVLLCEVSKQGESVGEWSTLEVAEGSVVVIDPYVAHTFYLKPGSTMWCLATAPFSPENMDMPQAKWLVRPQE